MSFAGLSRWQMLGGFMILLGLVWAMWVTRALLTPPPPSIVSARLSAIVGEYVRAQARSASPPERVEAEMRRFMSALEEELQRRSKEGEIVVVGEAVLSRNVPDITQSLRQAVYASGIALPRQATGEEMEALAGEAGVSGPVSATRSDGKAVKEPTMQEVMPDAKGEGADAPGARQGFAPGASVATFGGGDAAGNQ
ncbi:type-F conjugative transfer system protein TrbI [Sphingobium baderi]|uniref:type-F conjugative transfer system protein TrbI n=1 Tax=Sphingobium baderi TaxID=1332080 RepID=UPI002B40D82A|nr:type-F conjugative transfer system protein TrbI [Sphingobium baderi]WRD78827.1 type-F conjugative transfer system protein TrbI [Sphingobium baderi]